MAGVMAATAMRLVVALAARMREIAGKVGGKADGTTSAIGATTETPIRKAAAGNGNTAREVGSRPASLGVAAAINRIGAATSHPRPPLHSGTSSKVRAVRAGNAPTPRVPAAVGVRTPRFLPGFSNSGPRPAILRLG